jgi:threonine aldolase
VVFFREELARDYPYYRKQGMQLSSKMRFVSAQFQALLTDELWRRNASQANRMAQRLAEAVGRVTGVRISRPVEANAVFAILPTACARRLQARSFFYTWEETGSDSEVRWMASFDTTESDVDTFVGWLREAVG